MDSIIRLRNSTTNAIMWNMTRKTNFGYPLRIKRVKEWHRALNSIHIGYMKNWCIILYGVVGSPPYNLGFEKGFDS